MMKMMGVNKMTLDPKPLNKTTTDLLTGKNVEGNTELLKKIGKVQRELTNLEIKFVQAVVGAVGPERAMGVRAALLGDIAARGTGGLLQQLEERPLAAVLQSLDPESKSKSMFFTRFPGDVTASQVAGLREEVTAIVRTAKPGDEALVILQSGGGTVTGYGLAAAQLTRLKAKGIKLTIAVEQVAASGGYMMCCTADKIIASPFAVLGSIGVISDIPNVYERLKKEGM
jgi:ClpP class serine protease